MRENGHSMQEKEIDPLDEAVTIAHEGLSTAPEALTFSSEAVRLAIRSG